jgi:hypothetical protein
MVPSILIHKQVFALHIQQYKKFKPLIYIEFLLHLKLF